MKTIELRFGVTGELVLSDEIKASILGHYETVAHSRLKTLWGGMIPNREKLSINASGSCISLMDDWECTIFGKSYADYLVAFCAFHNLLVTNLQKNVTFELLSPESKIGTLDKLVRGERWRRYLTNFGWVVLGAIIALLIQWLVGFIGTLLSSRGGQ
jgi:hypothetical protein